MKMIEEFIEQNKDVIDGWITVDPDGEVMLFRNEPEFLEDSGCWISYIDVQRKVKDYGFPLNLLPTFQSCWRIGNENQR